MADFLGSVNLVRVPVLERRAAEVTVQLGEHALHLPLSEGSPSGAEALLAIRPETLSLGSGLDEARVALPGEVVNRTFLGHLMRYTVRVLGQDWLVDQPDPGGAALAEGSVHVLVNPRRVHVLAEA